MSLPPLQSFRYFDAAARLGSFKAAANELNVTQGAISQQIRALEVFLNRPLFERLVRKVILTEEGVILSQATNRALADLTEAVREIRSRTCKPTITVEVGPFISARWLTPQLKDFYHRHGDVEVDLHHAIGGHTPDRAVDLAILWGDGKWPAAEVRLLVPISLQPICSPTALANASPLTGLPSLPLLHVRDRQDWREWLTSAGHPGSLADEGPVFDEPNVAIEAAAAGLGLAIGYLPLIDAELRTGRLAPAHPHVAACSRGYYCVVATASALRLQPVRKFHDWLLDAATTPAASMQSAPQQPLSC